MSGRDEAPQDSQYLSQDPPEDTLIDRNVDDALDEGFSAPERWSAGEDYGTTAEEEQQGESLDQRLAQEIAEPDPYAEAEGEVLDDGEVGRERSGRLVDPDLGSGEDVDAELVGDDAGIDGAAASAEEAAVHTVDEEE